MKTLPTIAAVALLLIVTAFFTASSGTAGQIVSKALVYLQSVTPGQAQPGHINVSGTVVGGTLRATTGGVAFPDGSVQQSAAIGALPPGALIATMSPTPPPGGFVFTGHFTAPGTSVWRSRPRPPSSLEVLSAVVLNGRIYALVADQNTPRIAQFDPATNTWSITSDVPVAATNWAMSSAAGHIYLFGGPDQQTVLRFDPPAAWTSPTSMPQDRSAFSCATVQGRIFLVGGRSQGAPVSWMDEYDPATNSWSARAPCPFAVGQAIGMQGGVWVGESEGQAFAFFDPTTNIWSERAPSDFQYRFTLAVHNERLYKVGAERAQVYDPTTDRWDLITPVRTPAWIIAAFSLNGEIWCMSTLFSYPYPSIVESLTPTMFYWHMKQ